MSPRELSAARVRLRNLLGPELRQFLGKIDVVDYIANPVELVRILGRSLPALGRIDLVNGDAKSAKTHAACELLYGMNFAGDEAEPVEVIQQRRADMDKLGSATFRKTNREEWSSIAERYGHSRFRHVALTDRDGVVAGQLQMSVSPVGDDSVAVFAQYVSVADAEQMAALRDQAGLDGAGASARRRGYLTLLHAVSLAVAARDGATCGRSNVIGTFFESEMKGQAGDAEAAAFTYDRLDTHHSVGSRIMMLEMPDGSLLTPHLQPALGDEADPIQLHFMVRFPTYDAAAMGEAVRWESSSDQKTARDLVQSFFDNFEREGFAKADVDAARSEIMGRFDRAARVVFLPPEQTPDMLQLAAWDPLLRDQVIKDYGSLEEQAALMARARG